MNIQHPTSDIQHPKKLNDASNNAQQTVTRLLARKEGHVHLVGICGIGMAGLAVLLKARGFRVTGCDLCPQRAPEQLAALGIEVLSGHDEAHIDQSVDWIIRSAAVPPDCREAARALELGRPAFVRGAVVPELLAGHVSVAVGGTHGKTTTTAFIAQLLKNAGRDPSWYVGGETDLLGGISGAGQGGVIVAEADESDGTISLYKPDFAVITNVDFDHAEHFESRAALEECFRAFMNNAARKVIFCCDDERTANVAGRIRNDGPADGRFIGYGFAKTAQVMGDDLRQTDASISFTVTRQGQRLGQIELPAPGSHNALNALATVAVGLELGLNFEEIRDGLRRVGLPRRRFERVVEKDGILVISDYGHHPTEIAALIQTAARLKHERLIAVFQPHRYTRTLALGSDFPRVFAPVDELILTPVYAASEKPLKGGTVWDLYARFRARAADRSPAAAPRLACGLESAWAFLNRVLSPGDILLVIGAGDVEKIAHWAKAGTTPPRPEPPDQLLNDSTVRLNEPLADKTGFQVGGRADAWVEVRSLRDLAALLKWTRDHGAPFNIMGAGRNVLVSDLGLRGITARLAGADFCGIRPDADTVVAGAGAGIAQLSNRLEELGLAGLEFLEGIPGTVGGALRMNAGAWGHELGKHVLWIRCLNSDGAECVVHESELRMSYRRCGRLENCVAVEAALRVTPEQPSVIRGRRADIRKRREWMRGLRCAGSVFKNPSGDFAGRLIEAAGLKGAGVGGASISSAHANVIVARKGANASDVRALMEQTRAEVAARYGVELETEIMLMGW